MLIMNSDEKKLAKRVVRNTMDSEPLWFTLIGGGNVVRLKQELQRGTFDVDSKVFVRLPLCFRSLISVCSMYEGGRGWSVGGQIGGDLLFNLPILWCLC